MDFVDLSVTFGGADASAASTWFGLRDARRKVVAITPTVVSSFGCFVFEIWGSLFSSCGCFVFDWGCFVSEIWVLRASVFVFECFVFETTYFFTLKVFHYLMCKFHRYYDYSSLVSMPPLIMHRQKLTWKMTVTDIRKIKLVGYQLSW